MTGARPELGTPRLLVAFNGLQFALFPIPVITLFWKDQIGLSLTDIMVLQAIFGLSSVLFEFPSGYLADRIGHRTALLTGAFGRRATLIGCAGLAVAGYAGLAVLETPWAVVFYLCFMTTRGLQGPILLSVIQADAPDQGRASVRSLNALCFRLAFVACGPAAGALAERIGLESALGVLGGVVAVVSAAALTAFARAHD